MNHRVLTINPDFMRLRSVSPALLFGSIYLLIHSLLPVSALLSISPSLSPSPSLSLSLSPCFPVSFYMHFSVSLILSFLLYQRPSPLSLPSSDSSIPPLSLSSRRGTICPEADICKLTRLDGEPPRISSPKFFARHSHLLKDAHTSYRHSPAPGRPIQLTSDLSYLCNNFSPSFRHSRRPPLPLLPPARSHILPRLSGCPSHPLISSPHTFS